MKWQKFLDVSKECAIRQKNYNQSVNTQKIIIKRTTKAKLISLKKEKKKNMRKQICKPKISSLSNDTLGNR